jgi:glycosyltransferase involved in cell wall biosynthesis
MRIVFISYNYLPEIHSPSEWIEKIYASVSILESLAEKAEVFYIGNINYTGIHIRNKVEYHFFNPGYRQRLPVRIHQFVKALQPDVIVVPGFHFPLQVIQLKWMVGSKCRIALEYHADRPMSGVKKFVQQYADKYVSNYHFSSAGNATEFVKAGVINNEKKIVMLPSTTSSLHRIDKYAARLSLQLKPGTIFLWVGNLNENKDPLTVLKAFSEFSKRQENVFLYFIFKENLLLEELKNFVSDQKLEQQVFFIGKVEQEKLSYWYSAADFYINASFREGGSIALTEAMSCGCIPIVSEIPASMQAIENGRYGFSFSTGDDKSLLETLEQVLAIDKIDFNNQVLKHFEDQLSANAVSGKFISTYAS